MLLVYKITNENVILKILTWFDIDRYRCVRARCTCSQVSAFQHYHNLPLSFSLSQSLYSSPQAIPPLSVLIRRPTLLLHVPYAPSSLLPPSPLHPGPGLLDPSSGIPCQPHLPFWFLVHHLHWSHHSPSPPVPLQSVIRPPDQCRPRSPYPLQILHSPCPQLYPLPPST